MRQKDAVEFDLEQVVDYVPRTFGVEIDPAMIRQELEGLIEKKVRDYIFQRYKDWPVRDLLTAIVVLDDKFGQVKKKKIQ